MTVPVPHRQVRKVNMPDPNRGEYVVPEPDEPKHHHVAGYHYRDADDNLPRTAYEAEEARAAQVPGEHPAVTIVRDICVTLSVLAFLAFLAALLGVFN
jgi:hypothetical protein